MPFVVSTGYQSNMTMLAMPLVYGLRLVPKPGMSPNSAITGRLGSAARKARNIVRISDALIRVQDGSLTEM